MKRLNLLLVCLILALGLTVAARAEGTQPVLEVVGGDEKTWALASSDINPEDGTAVFNSTGLWDIHVTNDSEMSSLYGGEPAWSVEQTSGPVLSFNGWGSGSWYHVVLESFPSVAGEYVFTLSCEWGGQLATKTIVFHCVEMDLPTGSTVPGTLNMQVGGTVALDYDFDPEGWCDAPVISVGYCGDAMEYVREGWDSASGRKVLTALKPGVACVRLIVRDESLNVAVWKTVTVRIADENGVVPETDLTLDLEFEEKTFALAPVATPNGLPRIQDAALIGVSIPDYNDLANAFGGGPVWSFRQTAGAEEISFYPGDAGDVYHVWLEETPDAAGDYAFELTCQWGGQTATAETVIHFVEKDLPTETDMPDLIDMQVGGTALLDYHFLTGEWNGTGEAELAYYLNGAYNYVTTVWIDGALSLQAIQPGVARIEVAVFDDTYNIAIWKTITIFVADENGNVPGMVLRDSTVERTYAIVPVRSGYDTPSMYNPYLVYAEIQNYDELASFCSGSPSWTVRQTAGAEIEYRTEAWHHYCVVYPESLPLVEDDVVFEVTCEWGWFSAVSTAIIHFVEVDLPTGVNVPDTLEMQVGGSLPLDFSFTPAGWNNRLQIDAVFSGSTSDYLTTYRRDDGYEILCATQAGVTNLDICVYDYRLNLAFRKKVVVRIADENGVVPEPELRLAVDGEEEYTWALVPGGANIGTAGWRSSCLFGVYIDNYDEMASLCGGSPAWSVTQTGGEALQVSEWDDDSWYYVDLTEAPPAAGDYTFEVTCAWGGNTATKTVAIHYVDMGLPTDITAPGTLNMEVGDVITLDYDFVPTGWSDMPEMTAGYLDGSQQYVRLDWLGDGTVTLTALHAGVTRVMVEVLDYDRNACFWKSVTVRIADENGVVPEPELTLRVSGGEEKTWALASSVVPNGEAGMYDTGLVYARIDNYSQLSSSLGGSPVWTVTQTSGAELCYFISKKNDWCDVYASEDPAVGTYTFEVTCEWGGAAVTKSVAIHVVDMELPTGSTIPDTLEMSVNDILTLDYRFSPENWGVRTRTSMSTPGNAGEYLSIGWDDNKNPVLTALQAGITQVNMVVYDSSLNVAIRKTVTVRIADENGVVPGLTELRLAVDGEEEYTWALVPGSANIGTAGWRSSRLFGVYIDNYDEMASLCGGSPAWSVTQTGGEALQVSEWDDDSWYYVDLTEAPPAAGDYTFEVTCAWGGNTGTKTVTIHYVDMGLPTDITAPGTLNMEVGDVLTLDYDFVPAGWSGAPEITAGYMESSQDYVRLDWLGDGTVTLTALQAGVTRIIVEVLDYGRNVSFRKLVTVRIADENGVVPEPELRLPAFLSEIEEEAFAGISASVVVIPDGCASIGSRAFANCFGLVRVVIPGNVTIADDAFAGCSGFTIFTGSDAVAAWAQERGIPCVKE